MNLMGLMLASSAPSAAAWENVARSTAFAGWRSELQRRADQFGRTPENHFCIVVRRRPGRDGEDVKALVHWVEARTLVSYVAVPGDRMGPDTMFGPDMIDLDKSVVADVDGIRGSTSAVTRGYVDQVMAQCRKVGTQVVIRQKRG